MTLNARRIETISMWTMVFGIAALCQPWNLFLHRYGVTIILVGLIAFLITSHIGPAKATGSKVFDVSDHHEGKA